MDWKARSGLPLVLIQLSLLCNTAEALQRISVQNRRSRSNRGRLTENFR